MLIRVKLVDVTVCTTTVVPAQSEAVITAKLASPHIGLQPNSYTGVFEHYYREDSKIGFAWTVTKADKGSVTIPGLGQSVT